jgi:aminoglycoside phosphotransferase (APT) family kinase protein
MVTNDAAILEDPEYLTALTGLAVESAVKIAGGRSLTEKYIATTADGDYFVKAATGSRSQRSVALLEREAAVLRQLPHIRAVATFVDFREVGDTSVLITNYFDGTHDARWTPERALLGFRAIVRLYGMLAPLEVVAPRITDRANRFTAFQRVGDQARLSRLPHPLQKWILANIERLRRLESDGCHLVSRNTVMHCDLAVDNLLFRADGTVCLIDWSHAHLGNQLYDLASLLIRVRADAAWSTQLESDLRASIHVQWSEWLPMLVLATGSFLQESAGEIERPSRDLADERLRYAGAGVAWLTETL